MEGGAFPSRELCGGLSPPGVIELVLGKGWLSQKEHL